MRGILEPEHLILILLVVLVMFGGKKIPELAGGLGKGIREFKKGMNDLTAPAMDAALPPAPAPAPSATAAGPASAAPNAGPKRLIG